MSQTVASASTSLATGTIFTIPALFLWGAIPPYWQVVALSFLVNPEAWRDWVALLLANTGKGGTWAAVPIPLVVRAPIAPQPGGLIRMNSPITPRTRGSQRPRASTQALAGAELVHGHVTCKGSRAIQ